VTVTATRSEKKLQDAPVTASVISDQDIEDGLVKDIKDLVRFEPGVSVRRAPARFTAAGASTGRDGNAGFNIRGLEGNRVLILVDGVRVPDGYAFGAQNMGRGDYVDLDTLKSVEIVRGPASALYGSDGLAGSVSYFTKDPSDLLKDGKAFACAAASATPRPTRAGPKA
jgi:hemoglobin/transferrin/lactoferrin receptor protein